MSDDTRDIVRGLEHDMRILARELGAAPDAPSRETAVRTIDRMLADLRRLREQLEAGGVTEPDGGQS